jgi:hypothetical protein
VPKHAAAAVTGEVRVCSQQVYKTVGLPSHGHIPGQVCGALGSGNPWTSLGQGRFAALWTAPSGTLVILDLGSVDLGGRER